MFPKLAVHGWRKTPNYSDRFLLNFMTVSQVGLNAVSAVQSTTVPISSLIYFLSLRDYYLTPSSSQISSPSSLLLTVSG